MVVVNEYQCLSLKFALIIRRQVQVLSKFHERSLITQTCIRFVDCLVGFKVKKHVPYNCLIRIADHWNYPCIVFLLKISGCWLKRSQFRDIFR